MPAHKNPKYSTPPGNPTTDKIFLLSVVAAQTYFATDADRKADATRYAVKKGAYVEGSETGKGSYDGMCTDVRCTSAVRPIGGFGRLAAVRTTPRASSLTVPSSAVVLTSSAITTRCVPFCG